MTMIGHSSRTMADKPNRGTTHSFSNALGAPASSSSTSSSSFAAGTKSSHRTSTLARAANGSSTGSDPTRRISSSNHHLHHSSDLYLGDNQHQNHENHQNHNYQSHRTSFSTRPDQALRANHTNHMSHSSQPHSQSHAHASQDDQERIVRGVDKDGGLSSSSSVSADANFKAGMKLIQQAYEDRYQSLIDEANKWKWISEEQSVQMAAMAAELARVEESLSTLQKEMSQLETFRKAIVSMVDQHSGVSLTQLEQSILETIEADAEHVDAGYDVADADTSSFVLDGDVETSFSPHQQKHDREHLGSRSLRSVPVTAGTTRPRAATEAERFTATARTEIASTFSSSQSPNSLKKLHRFGSSDSLRSKRNTISSSTRPIYPSTSFSHNGTSKRHSSISPLSPKSRMTSARAIASSFSTNSTPSTSPREQTTLSAPSSRTTRHQQKEYSMGIRSTMSHLASLSVGSTVPTTSRRNVSSDAISAYTVASSPGSSDSAKRSRRSGSATLSMSNLSPAAMELLKQQERLQEQERGSLKVALANSPHSSRPVQSVGENEKRSSVQVSTISGSSVHADENSHGQSSRGSSARQSKDDHRYVSQSESEKTKDDPSSFSSETRRKQQSTGSSGVDASAFTLLYKEIRDSMDATSFGLFARVVTAFNEGEKTTNETLQEVSKIVKDRTLNQRFKNLIEQAIAEKENQLDEAGNETMDGDVTLEIDHSLLMDVEEGDEELIDEEDRDVNCGSINDSTGMGTADLKEFSSGSVGDDDYILDESNVDEHSRRHVEQVDETGGDASE